VAWLSRDPRPARSACEGSTVARPAGERRRCGKASRCGLGLAELLDAESRTGERSRIGLERSVNALEGHAHAVTLELVGESAFTEVVVKRLRRPVERMDDRQAEPPARLEHSGDLADRALQVLHVVERHVRQRQVKRA